MCKKITLKILNDFAHKHEGRCLSEHYHNAHEDLLWVCSNGHIFKMRWNSVQGGHWCQYCAKNIKGTIEECKNIAQKHNGKCLSEKYLNANSVLLWECSCGNRWFATFANIKHHGKWCKKCGFKKAKITNIKKYGVDHVFKNKHVRDKRKNTMIEKYGVEYPLQNKELALKSARSQSNSTILYHWKTNEEVNCQASYEKAVVEYLNKNKIDFDWQIKFDMPNGRKYFIDLYLKNQNLWVEIKGYMRKDSEEKWNWFHREYPNSELWNEQKLKEMKIL